MGSYKAKKYITYLIVSCCFLGRGVLGSFGYQMGEFATSNLTKIHPVSYLLAFVLIGNIFFGKEKIIRAIFGNVGSRIYFFVICLLMVYLFIAGATNSISFIVDTIIMPLILYGYLATIPATLQQSAVNLAVRLIMLNSLMAIIERILTINFFPILATFGYGNVFRSTALLGHPLNNALITLAFFLYLLCTQTSVVKKNLNILLLLAALVCFGARGCLYCAIIAIVLFYLFPVLFSKERYFKKINKFAAVSLMVVGFIACIYVVFSTSLGERLLQASFFDSSANVRVKALKLVDFENISNFFWAKSTDKIDEMADRQGLLIVENFMILWILRFGLIFAILILGGVFFFFVRCSAIKNSKVIFFIVLCFLLAAGTNNSLASNTEALVIFTLLFTARYSDNKLVF